MNIQRSMARGIAVLGAAAVAGVVAPAVSSAAPVQQGGSTMTRQADTNSVVSKQAAARSANAGICGVYGGTVRGCAGFRAYDEHLVVCDKRADGRSVYAQLYWAGKVRATVKDANGAKSPCYYLDLNIAEGTPVYVRAYVQGLGFTRWDRGVA
jgi:hypothetical protein